MKKITDDGALRLAAAILESTALSYMSALNYIQEKRKYALKMESKVRVRDEWEKEYYELKIIRKKKVKTKEEKERIERFDLIPEPYKPTERQIDKLCKYYEAQQERTQCELFYTEGDYDILCLGKGMKGSDVIRVLRKKVNYNE